MLNYEETLELTEELSPEQQADLAAQELLENAEEEE